MEDAHAPVAGLGRFAEKVATTFHRRTVVFAETIARSAERGTTPSDLEIGDLGASEIAGYLELRSDQTASQVHARLARGDRCRVIRHGTRIVHAGWLARGRADVPYLDGQLVLGPEDLYSYDSFTAPGWRGRGLAPARHRDLLASSAACGARRLLVLVAVENRSGLRVFAKLGYRVVGRYTLARLGPWRRWWVESAGDEALPRLLAPQRGAGWGADPRLGAVPERTS